MADDERSPKRPKTEHFADENGVIEAADPIAAAEAEATSSLQKLDEELERLAEDEAVETRATEKKFRARRADVYKRRAAVLAGVEQFWPTVMVNSNLRDYMTEWDRSILEYLSGLDVQEDEDDPSKFELTLYFQPNPVFKNVAIKRASMLGDGGEIVTCSPMDWHEGQDLTTEEAEDGSGPLLQLYTFFGWYITPGTYPIAEDSVGDPIAQILRSEVWLHPLELYSRDQEDDADAPAGDADAPESDDDDADDSGSEDGDEGAEAAVYDDEEEEDAL